MDRYDIVIDMVAHPEKYSKERIEEILSDPENVEVYNLLCNTETAFIAEDESDCPDVDKQWEKFAGSLPRRGFRFYRSARYAASVTALMVAAVAVAAIGIAVVVRSEGEMEARTQTEVPGNRRVVQTNIGEKPGATDEISNDSKTILFEDETLENIMKEVCNAYSVTVSYKTPATASLRLFYRFDPSLPLSEIVEQLNTFEQIHILIEEDNLIIN